MEWLVDWYPTASIILCLLAAAERNIDVVLVDTAGRMQDNEPLMRALSNVSSFNQSMINQSLK